MPDWMLGLGLVLISLVTALFGLLVFNALAPRPRNPELAGMLQGAEDAVFLFDGETLVDSSPAARAILATGTQRQPVWPRLMSFLSARFPDISPALLRLPHEGIVTLASQPAAGEGLLLQIELRGGLTRIALIDPEAGRGADRSDPLSYRAMNDELAALRAMAARAPILVWRQNAAGEVIWANPAYLAAAQDSGHGGELTWPLPRLFDRVAAAKVEAGQRWKLTHEGGSAAWFDLTTFVEGDGALCFGVPVDATVQAETALRDFMQTLTKTFAQLHVGLAIFDQARKLQLFNPALLDLTGLPIDFLSARPGLVAVLDAMRDRQMIPEPKDYRGWRRQILDMEKAATSGLYEETWTLPGGQTYRVFGRPHPNGALALMIEDISSEMLRTRRYRADLELGQAVLDALDEGVAVFSAEGQMVMANSAYAAIWGHDPAAQLADAGVATISRHWRATTAPSQIWAEVETFLTNPGDRLAWAAQARLSDGRLLDCRFVPLAGGATMAGFRATPAAPPQEIAEAMPALGAAARAQRA